QETQLVEMDGRRRRRPGFGRLGTPRHAAGDEREESDPVHAPILPPPLPASKIVPVIGGARGRIAAPARPPAAGRAVPGPRATWRDAPCRRAPPGPARTTDRG